MKARGFTLVEVAITLAIFALLVGLAVPAVSNITRVDLRSSASHTSGMIKGTYDAAVLSGMTHRLLFDFDKRTVTPQMATGYVALTRDGEPLSAKKKGDKKKDDKKIDDADVQAQAILSIAKHISDASDSESPSKAQWQAVPGAKPYELPASVHIADLQSEHLKDPVKGGQEAIYFFPQGYSEHALIHLEDDGGRVYGIEVEPLSGHTIIIDHKTDYKDDDR